MVVVGEGCTRLLSDTGRAAHMGGSFHLKFPAYGSVIDLNSGSWVVFQQ